MLLYSAALLLSALFFGACVLSEVLFSDDRKRPLLCVAGDDDADMKIVQGPFRPAASAEDGADKAAQEFLCQRDNGNIERARQLGESFAADLQEFNQSLRETNLQAVTREEHHHQMLLCSYVINRVIAEHSPVSVLAETSSSMFYKRVEAASPSLYQEISDTAAFSLYILNERLGSPEEIGRIYARLLGDEDNATLINRGNRLYDMLYEACRRRILEIDYVR